MKIGFRKNGQVVSAPSKVETIRSLAPVLQFMEEFIQDERSQSFMNENGTCRDLQSEFVVCVLYHTPIARKDLFRSVSSRNRPENERGSAFPAV